MLSNTYSAQTTRAEIGFEKYPSDTRATEANNLVQSLDGVIQTLADPSVRRMAVLFDPAKANISLILSALEPLGLNPRLVSVSTPLTRKD